MGWLGSDSVLPSGNSTGTRNFASAAYSSGGSCDRIRLRGRAGFNGLALWVASMAPSLCRGRFLWPQRRVAHNRWGVYAISISLGRLRAQVCAIQHMSLEKTIIPRRSSARYRRGPGHRAGRKSWVRLLAGYVRQLGAGLYSYLFLGNRAINKIVAIVREEMDTIGQEFYLPALNPREVWEESGRWAGMGQNMFRLKDRKGAELCLAMTHEEVMTTIARSELRSYKQLPQIWYQIQTKFRDEPRPKSGLLRVRQFLMKDAYSFDIDEA